MSEQLLPGYRQLSAAELTAAIAVKGLERQLKDDIERALLEAFPDHRWRAIAQTHFDQGFMALTRAITKPT